MIFHGMNYSAVFFAAVANYWFVALHCKVEISCWMGV